ncbi:MAG: hypothetical protein LC637_12345 [Xanthomonadaceae bacterium]|nr:hypothetical protein [Xanthomonadaceae bacterium]
MPSVQPILMFEAWLRSAGQRRLPAAGQAAAKQNAIGPADIDVRGLVAVQALAGNQWQLERALHASDAHFGGAVQTAVLQEGLVECGRAGLDAGRTFAIGANEQLRIVALVLEGGCKPRLYTPA